MCLSAYLLFAFAIAFCQRNFRLHPKYELRSTRGYSIPFWCHKVTVALCYKRFCILHVQLKLTSESCVYFFMVLFVFMFLGDRWSERIGTISLSLILSLRVLRILAYLNNYSIFISYRYRFALRNWLFGSYAYRLHFATSLKYWKNHRKLISLNTRRSHRTQT